MNGSEFKLTTDVGNESATGRDVIEFGQLGAME